MNHGKIVSVVGARPQFIKAAAVCRAIAQEGNLREIMIHTGQHYDDEMSGRFFRELGIPEPSYNLGIGGGGHGLMTGRMMEALEPILCEERPDAVLVYGDTNSTLAGSLTASKLHIPVAHVEAGLRSFNRLMPEEVNRVVCDHLSSVLYCPTSVAAENLAREGISVGVETVGDVMFDVTLYVASLARSDSDIIRRLGLVGVPFAVATIHRSENTDNASQLGRVIAFLRREATVQKIIFPIHHRTREALDRSRISVEGLTVIPPCRYVDMHRLLQHATTVYTDSGGLQKEAYFHRVPCVTLRGETEWSETVECGWNRLWEGPGYRMRRRIEEYGDGDAAGKISRHLAQWLDGSD